MKKLALFILFFLSTLAFADHALLLNIKGPIGPVSQQFFKKGLNQAKVEGAKLLILQLNTPGGLETSMRAMIEEILASDIPIVTYVAPSGARAASAGTYILYASPVAAMAPGTHLGAATPVAMGLGQKGEEPLPAKRENASDLKSAKEKKIIKDSTAYIRSLAQLRKRNESWAEKAVIEAETLSAEEALKLNVIDVIAEDVNDLLKKMDGKEVVIHHQKVTLTTKVLVVKTFQMDARLKFLHVITDPNIAYILLLVGIYGLFFEFMNPGMVLPGVVGAIALMVAIYALNLLPVSYAGIGLILLGIAFMLGESFLPSFGVLGIGGIIAFAIGSIFLLGKGAPGLSIALPVIIAVTAMTGGFFLIVVQMAIRSRFRPTMSGVDNLIGLRARVLQNKKGLNQVRVNGELWRISTEEPLRKGDWVEIVSHEGLILRVKRVNNSLNKEV